jgi:hypothetical protein
MDQAQEEGQLTKNVDGGGSFEPVITKTQIAGILRTLAIVCLVRLYEVECVAMIVLH